MMIIIGQSGMPALTLGDLVFNGRGMTLQPCMIPVGPVVMTAGSHDTGDDASPYTQSFLRRQFL
jgi:hypothetical protein